MDKKYDNDKFQPNRCSSEKRTQDNAPNFNNSN